MYLSSSQRDLAPLFVWDSVQAQIFLKLDLKLTYVVFYLGDWLESKTQIGGFESQ